MMWRKVGDGRLVNFATAEEIFHDERSGGKKRLVKVRLASGTPYTIGEYETVADAKAGVDFWLKQLIQIGDGDKMLETKSPVQVFGEHEPVTVYDDVGEPPVEPVQPEEEMKSKKAKVK